MDENAALRQLEDIADALAREGKRVLAARACTAVAALRRDGHGDADVMDVDEAATLLGIGNVGMIGRWAREGLLEGCRGRGAAARLAAVGGAPRGESSGRSVPSMGA